jgi:hypothetical protein
MITIDYRYSLPQNILYLNQGTPSLKVLHFLPLLAMPLGLCTQ